MLLTGLENRKIMNYVTTDLHIKIRKYSGFCSAKDQTCFNVSNCIPLFNPKLPQLIYRFTQIQFYIIKHPQRLSKDVSLVSTPTHRSTTPEDKELQNLLRLTTWNIVPVPDDFQLSTSQNTSSFTLLHPRSTYTMGETIEVLVTAKDHKGRPKTYGGDYFIVKLYSTSMKAGVTGSVQDHNDGTYTATFLLVWPGETKISVKLMHSSEAIAILHEKRDSRPDKIYFYGHYELNGTKEMVECNFDLPGRDVCEYYDAASGEKWVCVRPKKLPCNSYRQHSAGGSRDILTTMEMEFLSMSVTDQEIPINLKPLNVLPNKNSRNRTRTVCTSGLPIPDPSGFYYQDLWESLVCSNQHFPDASSVANCLAGKNVYMFGDSTLRQWWSYLVDFIPTLKEIDLHAPHHPGPHLATDSKYNFLVQWRAHQKPLRMETIWLRDLHYIASELDNLGGRKGMVIVINCWAHFLTFPIEAYVRRLRGIRDAVKRFLELNSEVKILIKSANTGYLFAHASDWLSLQLDTVMRAMFSDLPVTILDVWQMTSCHREPENLHPPKVIVKNEIDLMLSFICPS